MTSNTLSCKGCGSTDMKFHGDNRYTCNHCASTTIVSPNTPKSYGNVSFDDMFNDENTTVVTGNDGSVIINNFLGLGHVTTTSKKTKKSKKSKKNKTSKLIDANSVTRSDDLDGYKIEANSASLSNVTNCNIDSNSVSIRGTARNCTIDANSVTIHGDVHGGSIDANVVTLYGKNYGCNIDANVIN